MSCSATGALAASLMPKERINSISIDSISAELCTKVSFRDACAIMNRLLHRDDICLFRTMTTADRVGRMAGSYGCLIESISADALKNAGFDPETGLPLAETHIPESISSPCNDDGKNPSSIFSEQIDLYNSSRDECDQILDQSLIERTETDQDKCVYISIDDVGVRHQKDTRKDGRDKDGKVVENTVIHVQASGMSYILTAVGMDVAFRRLVAFLFLNGLFENHNIVFFSDGAQNIRKAIETYFSFCPYTHFLDWYHLEKRMTELLSMALKGNKDERHEIRRVLDRKLWAGNFNAAKEYLFSLDKKHIKNSTKLKEATEYLDRKKAFACCYALRSVLGYRNSSNPAEKANDLIVANRQKHNGMSWSSCGSGSLAILTAAIKNNELDNFLRNNTISFSMAESNGKSVA